MNKTTIRVYKLLAATGMGIILLVAGSSALAQPVINARNLGLGGGGTAYLQGLDAVFYNPANLAIRERQSRIHFSAAQFGLFYEPVLSSEDPERQFATFYDTFSPYRAGSQAISVPQREIIIQENYPRAKTTSQHQTRSDVLLGGVSYQWDDAALSIAARGRIGSQVEVGRGWYSTEMTEKGSSQIRDMTLIQREQLLYELSVGYSRRFDFINGLTPRINQLYVGIAPKFIMGGSYREMMYDGRYSDTGSYTYDFMYRSTGSYSRMVQQYLNNGDARQAIHSTLSDDFYLTPTGYGIGLDFGLTYLVPLGSDFGFIGTSQNDGTVNKSLRVALSVSDLGFVSYSDTPLVTERQAVTGQLTSEPVLDEKFIGSGGQFLSLADRFTSLPNPFLTGTTTSGSSFTVLLPTSLNAGVLLDLNRLKAMGDLTLGLQNTAFTNTKLEAHFGIELFPAPRWPVRVGTRLAAGLPIRFGLGTGYTSRNWDISVSTQILTKASSLTSELVGGALAGFQFHF